MIQDFVVLTSDIKHYEAAAERRLKKCYETLCIIFQSLITYIKLTEWEKKYHVHNLFALKAKVHPKALDRGEGGRRVGQRQASAALPSGKRPGTHCTGGWMGSGTGVASILLYSI
jgi:hypothetical protein